MSIRAYIKHRWALFFAIFVGGLFALGVYWADGSSALLYALQGIGLCMIAYIVTDFFFLRSRVKKMAQFLREEDDAAVSNSLDKRYAKMMGRVIDTHKAFREGMETQHAGEIEFITKWVHDVKVPISAIRLLTDSLDDELSQQLEMQTLYVEQNIQKILFHIKSKRFYEDYSIVATDVKSMVTQALKKYAVFFSYKKITLNLHCDSLRVATDEKWSGYIISQIISNAVKYTPDNGEIEIRAYRRDDSIVVSVKNTGSGIDEQSLKHVFKRGFSGDPFRRSASTGYGLYLSKKLADIMGHGLYAESVPGEYAAFFLVFNVTTM